jgi:hypothetical protein
MAPRGQGAQRMYLDPRKTGPLDWGPWRTHRYSDQASDGETRRRVCPATLRVPSRYERKVNDSDTSRKLAHAHIVPSRDRHRRFFKGLPMRVLCTANPGIRYGSIGLYQPVIHVVGVSKRFSRGQQEWTAVTEVHGYSVKFYRVWMLFLRIPTD